MHPLRFFPLTSLILLVFLASCSKDDSTVDPAFAGSTTVISKLTLSGYAFDTDTISTVIGREKSPSDDVEIPLGVTLTTGAASGSSPVFTCRIYAGNGTTPIASVVLTATNATTYHAPCNVAIHRGDVGDYRVEVTGVDGDGRATNRAISKFTVVYGTKPPVLAELFAPDTVALDPVDKKLLILAVRVVDSSGLADIRRVFFNSFLPNNAPASGNPFLMYDDGTHGDATANDGIFTLLVELPPTTQKGRYRFEFQAVDYSNLTSNVLIHHIIVI